MKTLVMAKAATAAYNRGKRDALAGRNPDRQVYNTVYWGEYDRGYRNYAI